MTRAGTRRGTARQAQLFDQLVALFLAEGFARFTLDDIAARLPGREGYARLDPGTGEPIPGPSGDRAPLVTR